MTSKTELVSRERRHAPSLTLPRKQSKKRCLRPERTLDDWGVSLGCRACRNDGLQVTHATALRPRGRAPTHSAMRHQRYHSLLGACRTLDVLNASESATSTLRLSSELNEGNEKSFAETLILSENAFQGRRIRIGVKSSFRFRAAIGLLASAIVLTLFRAFLAGRPV